MCCYAREFCRRARSLGGEGGAALCAAVGSLALGDRRGGANDATPTSPTSIDLTTAVSGRRPADALVLGAGVIAGKRVASIASIARPSGVRSF